MNWKTVLKKAPSNKPKKSKFREWIDAIVFAAVAATIIRGLLFSAYAIPSGSMEGTLFAGDFLFVSKISYGPRMPITPLAIPFLESEVTKYNIKTYCDGIKLPYFRLPGLTEIKKGDVVVFNKPEEATPSYNRPIDARTNLIKRCQATPGDELGIVNGQVIINGKAASNAEKIQTSYKVTFEDFKKLVLEQEHTRYPVYRKTLDDVIGFIHIKDLVAQYYQGKPFNLRQLVHQVLFLPPSMPVMDLLVKMRHMKAHIALVVDEFGGTMGLVTLEDIVEEIVGEIEDEHDEEESLLMRNINGVIDASARVSVEDIEKELGITLSKPDHEYDTLAGFIFEHLGRVPAMGEVFTHESGYAFEIKDSDMRSIKRVLIRQIKT